MNSSFSTVWYTTGDAVRVAPMTTRATIAITLGSPPPTANVATVAAAVAQPGHTVARRAPIARTTPQPFHMRMKPPSAVSPVASV